MSIKEQRRRTFIHTNAHMLEDDTSHKRRREHLDETESVEEIVLPFAKNGSRLWKEVESKEVFTRKPQRPHFVPLIAECEKGFREGFAWALTCCFAERTEKVENMDHDVPISDLEYYKETFALLEKHGFDVRDSLSRINDLLSSAKDGQAEEQNGSEENTVDDESGKEPNLHKKSLNTTLSRCQSSEAASNM